MKSLFFSLCLLTISATYGQVGISAGYGSAKATASGNGFSESSESANVFSFGVFSDIEISGKFDVQPYFNFGIGEKIDDKSNNALGFGANLQFYPSRETTGFFIGPSLAYGLSLADIDTDSIKKGIFEGGLQAGFDFSEHFTALLQFQTTLQNASKIDGIKLHARGFGVTLQYKF
jgi:hypothetical protein